MRRHDVALARRDLLALQTTHIATAAAYHGKPVAKAFENFANTLRRIISPPTPRSHFRELIAKLRAWKSESQ